MSGDSEEESASQSEIGYEKADQSTHPSLGLTLQEVRNLYEDEEARRRTIETKIGILVSINAIIITVVGSLGGISTWWSIFAIILALASVLIGLYILWPRKYQRPGPEDINDIFGDARYDPSAFKKQFINDYRASILSNEERNDSRYKIFKFCSILTIGSILFLILDQIYLQIC